MPQYVKLLIAEFIELDRNVIRGVGYSTKNVEMRWIPPCGLCMSLQRI